jgi:hypothetical protein
MRGRAEPRGIAAATDNTGTKIKAEIFAGAVKHINRELAEARRRRAAIIMTAPPRLPYGLQTMHAAAHEAEHAN